MLPNNFTLKSQEALQQAHNIALENGQQAIEPIHLFAALLEQEDGAVSAFVNNISTHITSYRPYSTSYITYSTT